MKDYQLVQIIRSPRDQSLVEIPFASFETEEAARSAAADEMPSGGFAIYERVLVDATPLAV